MEDIVYDSEQLQSTPANNNIVYRPDQLSAADLYVKYLSYIAPPFPQIIANAKFTDPIANIKSLFKSRGNLAPVRYPMRIRKPGATEWYVMPNEPIVSLGVQKQITRTTINRAGGKKGTVKEESYMGDYAITIDGLVIGTDIDKYPEEDLSNIRQMLETPGALEVDCDMLRIFNIHLMVIQYMDFPNEFGSEEHVQVYKIQAYSDEDFEEELINGD